MRILGKREGGGSDESCQCEKQIPHPRKARVRDDRFVHLFLMLLGAALMLVGEVKGQEVKMPAHEKVVLANGLTVLLLEKHSVPMVDVAGIVKTGGLADPVGMEGLASTTAGLLRKGTKSRTAQQFSGEIDFIGGTFGADAGADYTTFGAEFLSKDTAKGLALVADAVLHPTFPQDEVDKLLGQSVDGVKAAKDSARDVMFDYYDGYLYNGKGYGRPTEGDETSLKKIRRDAIVKFYETYYTPGNTILAVTGDFKPEEMKKADRGSVWRAGRRKRRRR